LNLLAHFRKIRRRDLAVTFGGIYFAFFGYFLFLWLGYLGTRPRQANPALDLTYPMNNHGWSYYLSAVEATQLDMLFNVSFLWLLLAALLTGRGTAKQPWEIYSTTVAGSERYFLVSLVATVALLRLASYWVASFLVSKGIILEP
jgi:hypothetical protein